LQVYRNGWRFDWCL